MSRTIEREITALSFDAREFKSGINESLKDIDRMKKGLNFDGAIKGFSELDKSSKRVNFGMMGDSIQSVTARLSAMGVIGATIVNRLTNAVIDGTTKIFQSLVTNPLKMGLEEYETQINAIQTILSNTRTKGTILSDVTEALDELNLYADLTIYNFTEMTKNIGTFTAAGVELDTAVGAIKGIANLAAVSGSSSQQASVAMYQLSQAISSGTVKLMDWNSVVNAGMGGELFKQLLIDFGEVTGQIREGTVTTDKFRDSLQDGWLTSDVLLKALQAMAGELDQLALIDMGFSEEDAAGIIAMADDAIAAATDIKTATQLIDVAIEAMQSGWSQTWRLLLGDFEEAKELFGSIGDIMSGAIESGAAARNQFVQVFVARGGRDYLIQIFTDSFKTLLNVVNLFKSATADVFAPFRGFKVLNVVRSIAELVEKIKMASESGDRFKSIVRGLASIFDILKMLVIAVLKPLFGLKDGVLDTADGILDMIAAGGDWLFNLRNMIKDTDYFGTAVSNLIAYVRQGIVTFKDWIDTFIQLEPIQDIISILQRVDKSDFVKVFQIFKGVLIGIGYVIGGVVVGVQRLLEAFTSLTPVRKILDYIGAITYDDFKAFLQAAVDQIPAIVDGFNRFGDRLSGIGQNIKDFFTNFRETKAVKSFVDYINSMDGSRIKAFFADLKLNFDWIPGALGSVKELLSGLGETLSNLLPDASEVGESVGGSLSSIFDYLGSDEINFVGLANVLTAGLVTAIALGLKNLLGGGFITNLLDKYIGEDSPLVSAITGTFESLQNVLTSWQNNLKADTLTKIAIAIGIVAASALALSLIDQNKLAGAVVAMGALMTELFGGAAVISRLSLTGLNSATLSVAALAAGLLVLSVAVKAFSRMDQDELQRGLIATGIAISGFVVAIKALSIGPLKPGMISSAIAFGILSGAMLIFARAMTEMGTIPYDVATDGLIRMGAALLGFIAFSKLVSSNEAILTAIAIGGLGGAIVVMAKGLEEIGKLSWEELLRGLAGLAGSLLILAGATKLMIGSLPGAAAIVVLSVAMIAMAHAMSILGELSWEGILKSLAALAGVFLVFGVAGYLLGPVVPILLGLAAGMALIGVAALALGAGIGLAAAGLVLLAGSAAAVATAIAIVGGAVILILPKLAEAIALAIASFLQTLADNGPKIFEAGVELLLGLIDSITTATPEIVEMLLVMIGTFLDLLAEHIPDFVDTGFELLLGILKGIEDNIEDVVESAVGIATKFIEGLTDSIPDLVDAGFEFVTAFVTAVMDATVEHGGELYSNAWRAASNVVNGFVEGVLAGIDSVIAAARQLAQAAIDAWNELWNNKSPSKLAIKMAGYVTQGLVIGLDDGSDSVVRSITRLGEKAQNGMNQFIDKMYNAISDDMNLNPVIQPVLDMSVISSDINNLNNALSGSNYAANVSTEIASKRSLGRDKSLDTNESIVSESKEPTIVFEQNNYSPKALSTIDIYRKTKSQLARLERRKLA